MSAESSARAISETEKVDKVRALQRVLYRSAKQDPTRRFHALYDKVARSDILWRAWVEVAQNQGAPGIDGVTIASIEDGGTDGVRVFLDGLAAALQDKTYRPNAPRRVHIPKPGKPGETRPLGIPTVADRVVMSAARIVLEPIFEADFSPMSFGFRPKRSAHQALEAIRVAANRGAKWVLDADIKACFDEIDHDALMGQVERRVVDRQMLKLLRSWLRAGVVLTTSRSRAEEAKRRIGEVLVGLGLRLHPDKTRIVNLTGGKDGFDFLGFHHRMTPSRFGTRRYLSKWPSDRAMAALRAKIRDRTSRHLASRELRHVVAELNAVLRGWGAYFRYGNSNRKFALIDSYVHLRLSKLASVKYATRGRLRASRFNYGWLTELGTYRLTGRVKRWTPANARR